VLPSIDELKSRWAARGVTGDKEIALYSNAGTQAGFAYFTLRLLGYPRVAVYEGSMDEWSKANVTAFPLGFETGRKVATNHPQLLRCAQTDFLLWQRLAFKLDVPLCLSARLHQHS
jgi:hypothetical protein